MILGEIINEGLKNSSESINFDWTTIITSVIGFVGIVVTTCLGLWAKKREALEKHQALREMQFQKASLDFSIFLDQWYDVTAEIEKLMQETCIDRFIILRAWNGTLDPKWTTAVFQIRSGEQKLISYVHFELDDDYRIKLRETEKRGFSYYSCADLDDCYVKAIYKAEEVTSCVWAHIETNLIEGTNAAAITYCSFATHNGEIDENTQTRCRLIASRLKGVSGSFKDRLG